MTTTPETALPAATAIHAGFQLTVTTGDALTLGTTATVAAPAHGWRTPRTRGRDPGDVLNGPARPP